jgi:hypothetical protein
MAGAPRSFPPQHERAGHDVQPLPRTMNVELRQRARSASSSLT